MVKSAQKSKNVQYRKNRVNRDFKAKRIFLAFSVCSAFSVFNLFGSGLCSVELKFTRQALTGNKVEVKNLL
jgi:hypothetical protein